MASVCGSSLSLMAAGFRPHADDVVLIDSETLSPLTFPRAFHVDDRTRALVEPLSHDPDWEVPGLPRGYFLPTTWADAAAPVGAVVFPKALHHPRPLMVQLPVAEGATTLLRLSGTLDATPALALRTTSRMTAAAPCYALYTGDVAATAELVATSVARLVLARART